MKKLCNINMGKLQVIFQQKNYLMIKGKLAEGFFKVGITILRIIPFKCQVFFYLLSRKKCLPLSLFQIIKGNMLYNNKQECTGFMSIFFVDFV